MARQAWVLPDVERAHGNLETVIPETVNRFNGNQRRAAEFLNVSSATISRWLKENGYRPVVRWEREA